MTNRPPAIYLAFYYIAIASALASLVFVFNNFLLYSFEWPGAYSALAALGIIDGDDFGPAGFTGFLQLAAFIAAFALPAYAVWRQSPDNFDSALEKNEARLRSAAAYIISLAFWSVMFVGIVDATISFMRIEGFLAAVAGDDLASNIGRSVWRGSYIHIPLIVVGALIALKYRGINFVWLATLIVVAELLIVIARFIFSYEQAFMGDLVRFWYAALFLFASAQTLVEEGHVRVDVLYAGLSEVKKAVSNVIGAAVLGIPLCWVILSRGLWEKTSTINGALLKFETSQSGFGMYVKYLMAGFLIIFAFSMILQFSSFIMTHLQKHIQESRKEAE